MKKKEKEIAAKYKKLGKIEHILAKPGMYVGSIENTDNLNWILDDSGMIIRDTIKYPPALYKIFDEIIVNAYDQTIRDESVTEIKVDIDIQNNQISVYNDGIGIDIVVHPEHGIYIPELIFGKLMTSTNFDDSDKRVTGGTFGLGAKLTAIFSKKFIIEVGDPVNKKKFKQIYENNLSIKSKPEVKEYNKSNGYVKISYIPDLEYFKINNIDPKFYGLLKRRVYDISMLTRKNVRVYLADNKISIKSFVDYVSLFKYNNEIVIDNHNILQEKCTKDSIKYDEHRWQIIIVPSDGKFNQISFVNGIYTSNGGKHVEYISDKVIKMVKTKLSNKFKDVKIKDSYIKDQMWLYISCIIENPVFSSQTKEEMITSPSNFGSSCELGNNMVDRVIDLLDLNNKIKDQVKEAETKELVGTKSRNKNEIKGIKKLHDANYAGTKRSKDCTLILTEGDSAKTMAVTGVSAIKEYIANDYFGIFPLKGKLLNVRDATNKQIVNNEEFINLKRIIGLEVGKEYNENNRNELRYGKILLMMDADVDGSHIKGLFINMIDYFWPSLIQLNGFIHVFITPMIKVSNNNSILNFYTFSDFDKWKLVTKDFNKWKIKYYKGLGTSTSQEAKEYFINLNKNMLTFKWIDNGDFDSINLAFDKDMADDRKRWLKKYDRNFTLDYSKNMFSFSDFINKELIHFSNYDNIRSIPNIIDGFKPAQRKILYSALKKNVYSDIKVAQFVGYASEMTAYHHGEISLSKTIIGMAQNFVGSNNINLLIPNGQFGTRLMGGKDAASPRYIFTFLNDIVRFIFNKEDDDILNYLNDDGMDIEPDFYLPIIPMILINGCEGIGTGYSTYIAQYNIIDVIDNIIKMINGKKISKMHPWFRSFNGTIQEVNKGVNIYVSRGIYSIVKNKLIINELPVYTWTENYKEMLDDYLVNGIIKKYKNNSTESEVYFEIELNEIDEKDLVTDDEGISVLDKKFMLYNKINLNNMHLYNAKNIIEKYYTPEDIIQYFYKVRLEYYYKRKQNIIDKLKKEILILEAKIVFIELIIDNKKSILNMPKDDIIGILKKKELFMLRDEQPFDYLFKMSFYSFTKEKIDELNNLYDEKTKLLNNINKKDPKNMWLDDLNTLKKHLFDIKYS